MPRKGENIRKRSDGRWEARICHTDSAGWPKCTSLYAKSYKEAREKKRLFLLEHVAPVPETCPMMLGSVMEEWMSNDLFRQKEATKLKYQLLIDNHIKPGLGSMDIREIDETVLNHFLADKLSAGRLDHKGGLSCAYVRTMVVILNAIFAYAASRDYCMPLKNKIVNPVLKKKGIDVMSVEEQMFLETELQSDPSLAAVGVALALNAGLRVGEICALCWEDVDLGDRLLHIRHTVARVKASKSVSDTKTKLIIDCPKTKTSEREIPITSKLLHILERANASAVSRYVISGRETFLSPRTFEYQFHRLLRIHSIPDLNFHALRHTFATRCVEMGVDAKTLSEILGHADVSTTLNTYVHPSLEVKRMQLEKLSKLQ